MGQAWCKEKSTKAQDSKSPLDRVFLRCAHRIYPALKEEGSVLGGATQRVTSSEIGYASSPPREILTRGQSIDSVDRPFQPSDWVDVNLEVPITPRANSAIMNLTLDTTIYPPTTISTTTSSGSNLRDFTPIPPPRRRKKNRGRPLPPKPDELAKSHVDRVMDKSSKDSRNLSHEPLYWQSNIPKNWSNDKDIYEYKINGTGKIIPSIVVAAMRSNHEKTSRDYEKIQATKSNSRPKNSSTVSLPNYSELEVSNDDSLCDDDGEIKIHKITAAGSLPALITSGALENLKKSDDENKFRKDNEAGYEGKKGSIDEVDFSFDSTKNLDAFSSILGSRVTSTPVKNDFDNDSRTPTTIGGWFLHQDRAPVPNSTLNSSAEKHETASSVFFDCQRNSRNDIFFEAMEDLSEENEDNHTRIERDGKPENRTVARKCLKRTLSNESEPFDSCEEKELREGDSSGIVRSNSPMKLLGRTISEESLPEEMLENETDFFDDKRRNCVEMNESKETRDEERKLLVNRTMKNDTKTPPPSPEPKIKPEIQDNDHSTLLKVLRNEASEESNLSSMTPSLTELEAALSDMLERDEEQENDHETASSKVLAENLTSAEKELEGPIEPKILPKDLETSTKSSSISVSLKNILGERNNFPGEKIDEDSPFAEIELTNDDPSRLKKLLGNGLVEVSLNNMSSGLLPLEPPEKPSRLHQVSLNESSENLTIIPTPPRRQKRFSGTNVIPEKSVIRTVTPDNPYPNDRLI